MRLRFVEFPLESVGLSRRAFNCLRKAGFKTVKQVAETPPDVLGALPGVGTETLAEIRYFIKKFEENFGFEGFIAAPQTTPTSPSSRP